MTQIDPFQESTVEPIAIIGMGLRIPGADTIEAYWRNLSEGVESITFFSDDELRAAGVSEETLKNPDYVKAMGRLKNADQFDADFFGMTPRDAEILDPQQRVFLECVWETLEHSGYDPEQYDGQIALFGGIGLNGYLIHNLLNHKDLIETMGGWHLTLSNDKDFATTRTSYKLNLQGPSINVSTACSTSLVAVALSCQSLLTYQTDMVVAGGCSIHLPQNEGYWYTPGGTLSPDGHCRPFDAKAQGTIDGNGAAFVVLKRLADAKADGDTIHGVIRGFGVNNDGNMKVGYTAPSVDGQAEVILDAQTMAGISANQISYIETHGTATDLGDPIEIAALTQAFRETTDACGFCAIGSVKSNVGHLDTAAGTASLIKTILAMKHQQIPPSLHFETPNPKIDFKNTPFYVNNKNTSWPKKAAEPRIAGISSFGIGGTNAHVIVSEAPEPQQIEEDHTDWHLLLLSARNPQVREQQQINLYNHLQTNPETPLSAIAYTLQAGRHAFLDRQIILCQNRRQAEALLTHPAPPHVFQQVAPKEEPPVIFLFPGQDSLHIHMAYDLYQRIPLFRSQIEACADILKNNHQIDLYNLLYPETTEAHNAEDLRNPIPLFVIEYALAQLWRDLGITPQALFGISLGEYVAATLSGVLSLEDALSLLVVNHQLINDLEPGAMIAIACQLEDVESDLKQTGCRLAMVSTPEQIVVAGATAEINALIKILQQKDMIHQRLPLNRAFHTDKMTPILEPLRDALEKISFNPPEIPYISSVTGHWINDHEATDPAYYLKLTSETLQLNQALQTLFIQDEKTQLLEVGPQQVLYSLVKQHPARPGQIDILSSLPTTHNQSHNTPQNQMWPHFLTTLGKLWLAGIKIDWQVFSSHRQQNQRTPLPTYPFEHQSYWIDPVPQTEEITQPKTLEKSSQKEQWFYLPQWQQAPLLPTEESIHMQNPWMILMDQKGVGEQLADALEKREITVVRVYHNESASEISSSGNGLTLDTTSDTALNTLFEKVKNEYGLPKQIITMTTLGLTGDHHTQLDLGYHALVTLGYVIGQQSDIESIALTLISDQLFPINGAACIEEKTMLLGPMKVIPQEYPHTTCCTIDLELTDTVWKQQKIIDQLCNELCQESNRKEQAVALRYSQRWIEQFSQYTLDKTDGKPIQLRDRGVYLITGGMGNIGLSVANYLVKTTRARLVLIGRSTLPDQSEWADIIADPDTAAEQREQLKKLSDLTQQTSCLILQGDVSNKAIMGQIFDQAENHFGAIHGIIHAAGLVDDYAFSTISEKNQDNAKQQFIPKVAGVNVLADLLSTRQYDFCLLCSSLSSILGGIGFSAYASANLYLDAKAYNHNQSSPIPWVSINWEGWNFNLEENNTEGMGAELIKLGMTPEEGCEIFERILSLPHPPYQLIISSGNLHLRIDQWIKNISVSSTEAQKTTTARSELLGHYVAPETETEKKLAPLWEQILGIHDLGILDNFFALGGNSLLLTQLLALIRRTFHIEIDLTTLFEAPTITDMAIEIDKQFKPEEEDDEAWEEGFL
ncbi:beta-ketoacyl synthase N-terminal-like domain-containing protein [Magnetococcales bacterium HHB-1]